MPPEVVVASDPTALARAAAERFAGVAEKAVARAGRFTVALAGGSTPKGLYATLADEPSRSRIPWSRTEVFWGDERCVPPDHAESNYRMAAEALLRGIPIPPEHIHRMRGGDPDPDRAASDYERVLRAAFRLRAGALPRFALILLGLGTDGHVASLFPGSRALCEVTRLVVAPYVEQHRGYRLTLTLPVINEACVILFLVSGQDKAEALHTVLTAPTRDARLPAQHISPGDGRVIWLVDRNAAALLEPSVGADTCL
jgi:6-phosphogluconolactonase